MEQLANSRNRAGRVYDRSLGKLLPSSRAMAAISCFVLNCLVYWGAQHLTAGRVLTDMTTAFDRMVPLVPAWVIVYFLAFPFWAVGYVLLARGKDWYSVMSAEVICKLICGACFLILPTTNVRPEVPGSDLFSELLRRLYAMDAATNLFPSIHCLESWICFAGLRGRKDVPLWYRIFSCVFALMICASTLFTYQHVIADVVSGVLLAEVMLCLMRRLHAGGKLEKAFLGLDQKVFGEAR